MNNVLQAQAPGGHQVAGVILTGAAGGIGEAMARALVQAGHPVMLVGRDAERLQRLRGSLQSTATSAHIICVSADLTTVDGRGAVLGAALSDARWRILVNNAGTSEFHAFETQRAEQIAHILNTNLTSPMLLTQALLPTLLSRADSQVINIGSVFGDIGYPGFAAYCASKFGLRGFTQALRRELSDTGLRVRWFAPRATQTPLNSPAVVAMNAALKTQADSPDLVARLFMDFFGGSRNELVIGWPEKLFVLINRVRYAITDGAIGGQLSVIRRYMPR